MKIPINLELHREENPKFYVIHGGKKVYITSEQLEELKHQLQINPDQGFFELN